MMRLAAFRIPATLLEKAVFIMEVKLHVGSLPKTTTDEELNALFAQAGKVTVAEIIKDRKSGESRGFAFVTMSTESEADQAISMFDNYSLEDHALKVSVARAREQRSIPHRVVAP